mmetsp:Transcript_5478/g.13922  ORF Transcript_5478/g.13922 Transcript_5478/m.13922 type:complete len:227 (-) Transcript_5478:77-757(-)
MTRLYDLELKHGLKSIVVAPATSQVSRGNDIGATAEDIVDTTERSPSVDWVEATLQALHCLRLRSSVEIADKDDDIVDVGIAGDELQQVKGRCLTAAHATGVHWQRAMVVEKEDDLARFVMLQAGPHPGPCSVPLIPTVLADILGGVSELLPSRLPVGHAHRMRPWHGLELAQESRVADHPVDVLALLEAHEIERLLSMCRCNQLASRAAVAIALAEEVPPEEVVG